jgi:ABC-2 type transport system ATP-binding protein
MKGIVKNLFRPRWEVVKAVKDISFTIFQGDIIGFIGPNGAGKSTTIKMLTGILSPTSGTVHINGKVPLKNRKVIARDIGVIFGHKTQLWWNLPVRESFDLIRTIYKIEKERYHKNIAKFSEILEIEKFLDTPVRQLSLGQRMRVEIAGSLLHNPSIVFLDEPTIGLDIIAKEKILDFIDIINKDTGVTIILTTHDMNDIEKLCKKIIVIDQGKIIYQGLLNEVREKYNQDRILIIETEDNIELPVLPFAKMIKEESRRKHFLFNRNEISAVELVQNISEKCTLKDFSLEETKIDNIIKKIYGKK